MSTYPSKNQPSTTLPGTANRSDHQRFNWVRKSFDPTSACELDALDINSHDCRAARPKMAAPLPERLAVPGRLSSPLGHDRMTMPHRTNCDTWVLTAAGHRYVPPIGRNKPWTP